MKVSKRFDPESGWIYFGRRYYDPNTGRWTTPDPIGFADGPNLYAYVKNNPLTHFDAYGLYETIGRRYGQNERKENRAPPSESRSLSDRISSLYQSSKNALGNLWNSPRFRGGCQAFGGLLETGSGTALALRTSVTGVGLVGGCAVMAHGMDHYIAGMNQVFSGTSHDTMTFQGLQAAGL